MKTLSAAVPAILALASFQTNAWGVLVATPNPGNPPDTAPANGAPWANLLLINNNSSSVYLGNGWVLTAEHLFDDIANPFVS